MIPSRVSSAATSPVELSQVWAQRLDTVEQALARAGRQDLIENATAVARGALPALESGERDQAVEHLKRFMKTLKMCAVDPKRRFDDDVLSALRSLVDQPNSGDRLSLATAATPSERASAPEDRDGLELLGSFGEASDDELDLLLGGVEVPDLTVTVEPYGSDGIGTLREPLDSQPSSHGAQPRILMKGELHDGLVSDLIQLFSQNRESGLLFMEGVDKATASLFFHDGRVVDAECGDQVGEEAFYHLMQIREGRFTYQRGVEAAETRIFRNAQHLIMDTLRLLDEQQ
ncbi:MAG: DUF4388 domain-containing protein [Myxococcota bacterium]